MISLGIVFDLDGTLIDSLGDITGVVNEIRGESGLTPLPETEVAPFVGWGVEYLLEHTLSDLPEDIPMAERVREYRERYSSFRFVGRVYPGVRETLLALRENGFRLGIATNRLTGPAKRSVAHYLPDVPFERIAGPDAVSRPKPDPAHLLEVLSAMGVPPAKAFFVGDHAVDRDCAAGAGVAFFGARYGLSGVEVEEERALHRFADLLERVSRKTR